jgi:CheY-like chemotaxis protein
MDMQMPVLDGLSATRAIRALEQSRGDPPVPIIMLSANAMTHHVAESLRAGADAHVPKPIDASFLLRKVAELSGPREEGESLSQDPPLAAQDQARPQADPSGMQFFVMIRPG